MRAPRSTQGVGDGGVGFEHLESGVGRHLAREAGLVVDGTDEGDARLLAGEVVLLAEAGGHVDHTGALVGGHEVARQHPEGVGVVGEEIEQGTVGATDEVGPGDGAEGSGLGEQIGVGGRPLGGDGGGSPEELVDVVGDVGAHGQGQVRGQRPRGRRPHEQAQRTVGQRARRRPTGGGVEVERHRHGRVDPGPVGVVLAGLEIGEGGLALPAEGQDALAFVGQALLPQTAEGPHDALHVGEVHGLVRVGEVDPAGLAGDVVHPGVGGALDEGAAVVVEAVDAEGDDVGAAAQFELLLGRHLGRQPVTVPAEPALHPATPHGLVTRHGVLHEAGEQVSVVGEAVGERRSVVEDVFVVAPGAGRHRRREGAVALPEGQDPLFEAGVVGLLDDLGIGGAGASVVGHRAQRMRRAQLPTTIPSPGRRHDPVTTPSPFRYMARTGSWHVRGARRRPRRRERAAGRQGKEARCCLAEPATLWSPTFVKQVGGLHNDPHRM